jgi:hypothetical protein
MALGAALFGWADEEFVVVAVFVPPPPPSFTTVPIRDIGVTGSGASIWTVIGSMVSAAATKTASVSSTRSCLSVSGDRDIRIIVVVVGVVVVLISSSHA